MSKLKLGVIGANGRMGREILELIKSSKDFEPSLGIDIAGKNPGFKKFCQIDKIPKMTPPDVIIDFTQAQAFDVVVSLAQKWKVPIVSGTTGISQKQKNDFKRLGRTQPVLWSPNMSIGIACLQKALTAFSAIKDFDFHIEEIHHKRKIDKPSGTANLLQLTLETHVEKNCPEPLSIRGGGVFGVHRVWALGENETLCFEHAALNRKVFAEGALAAALWLANKKRGYYSLQDVLK